MTRKQPRDYQKDIIEQVVNSDKSTLIQIPTGGGKTYIAYEIATDLIARFDQQVLFVAPRENLVHQTAEEFKFAKPHIVHTSNKEDKGIETYDFKTYPLLISTLQTAYRRENIDPDVIIIDETHFGFDGKMINKLKESNKHSRIIGLSATPYDKFGRQLQGFDLILDKYDMKYMIKNKYLVPLKSYKRQKIKGLEKIKITQGDYDLAELEQVVCNNHTIMEIAETTKDKVEESNRTIVFAVTIKHADLLAEAYKKYGFTTRSLHSKSEENDKETIDYFKKGYIKVLVSVSKLTTGFDVPATDCAVIARPTKSQNLYKQMVGRILRLSPETHKTHAVLLDCGNVIDTLGDPLAPIKLMEPKESDNKLKCHVCESENLKLKKMKDGAFWECQECGHLKKIKEGTYKCSHCGNYSNKNSKFIIEEKKIILDCSFCHAKTTISEFLEDEELVCVNDVENNDFTLKKNYTGPTIIFTLDEYENTSAFMRKNDSNGISRYISTLMKKYKTDFNTIWFQLGLVMGKGNQPFFPDHPIGFLLPVANETKDFSSIQYILESNEELRYSILSTAVKNNFVHLEKYLMLNYVFKIEDTLKELVYDECIDYVYELNDNEILNSFFKKYGYLWDSFEAFKVAEDYYDPDDEDEFEKVFEKVLMGIDHFFEQYGIAVQIQDVPNPYKYYSFIQAREFVHKLKLKSFQEWRDYINNELAGYDKKPIEIPDYPHLIYKKEWIGLGDWLGIEYLDSFLSSFPELFDDYIDGYKKKISMYQCEISEDQFNKYSTVFYKMDDENIHEMVANLDYSQLEPDIVKSIFYVKNTYIEFINKLHSNPTIPLEIKIKNILMDENNTDQKKVVNLISDLAINIYEVDQLNKLINKLKQSTDPLPYTPNFTNWDDSNLIIDTLKKRLEKIIENKEWERYLWERIPQQKTITHDEFEKIFELKTKQYLKKKEKTFANPLEFKKFLDSEEYKQITITRRNQIMEGYKLIDTINEENK